MQTAKELGKYVTDGTHTYPYNAHLDELLNNGKLHFCDKPAARAPSAPLPKITLRSPITMAPEERAVMAEKMGISLGELTNMSPQEYEAELAKLSAPATQDGFPAA